VEEDLLGGFYSTRKPYLTGMGSSAWGVDFMLFGPNVSRKTPKIGSFVTTEFGGVRKASIGVPYVYELRGRG